MCEILQEIWGKKALEEQNHSSSSHLLCREATVSYTKGRLNRTILTVMSNRVPGAASTRASRGDRWAGDSRATRQNLHHSIYVAYRYMSIYEFVP